jgi:hypothetical protein
VEAVLDCVILEVGHEPGDVDDGHAALAVLRLLDDA